MRPFSSWRGWSKSGFFLADNTDKTPQDGTENNSTFYFVLLPIWRIFARIFRHKNTNEQ